eukprot:2672997-Rhodomonas_salina.1
MPSATYLSAVRCPSSEKAVTPIVRLSPRVMEGARDGVLERVGEGGLIDEHGVVPDEQGAADGWSERSRGRP